MRGRRKVAISSVDSQEKKSSVRRLSQSASHFLPEPKLGLPLHIGLSPAVCLRQDVPARWGKRSETSEHQEQWKEQQNPGDYYLCQLCSGRKANAALLDHPSDLSWQPDFLNGCSLLLGTPYRSDLSGAVGIRVFLELLRLELLRSIARIVIGRSGSDSPLPDPRRVPTVYVRSCGPCLCSACQCHDVHSLRGQQTGVERSKKFHRRSSFGYLDNLFVSDMHSTSGTIL